MEWRPTLDWANPLEEREIKHHVDTQIHMLDHYVRHFRRDVTLMDHCEGLVGRLAAERAAVEKETQDFGGRSMELTHAMHEPWDWMGVAARDAVMNVYHFGSTLKSIRSNAGKAESWRGKFDSARLKGAVARFDDRFPFHAVQRHALAHMADNMRTPEAVQDMWPENGPLMLGVMTGRTYGFNQKDDKGRDHEMRLDVTADTLNDLNEIKQEAWEAFRELSVWK